MAISVLTSLIEHTPPWADIFNSVEFFNLHKQENSHFLTFNENSKLLGFCHFTEIERGIYRSPYKGTYGGFSFLPNLSLDLMDECLAKLIEFFRLQSAKKLSVVCAPSAHNLNKSSMSSIIFRNRGFQISNQELNQSLCIDENCLADKMMSNNRKRFNKCQRENFRFARVEGRLEIDDVYETIKINRLSKGYPVTMTLSQIYDMVETFPEHTFFFKVTKEGKTTASSICLKLNNEVFYILYWADAPGYEQHSPVSFLAGGIYEFARERNFKLLDAGISTLNGIPNHGLINFKQNLGFSASLKLTFEINL